MDQLQDRLHALEQQMHTVTRRLRWWRGLAGGLLVLAGLTWALPSVIAQEEATEKGQKGLAQRVAALEKLLQHFSREKNEIFITGANLHIVNGLGRTDCGPEDNPIPDCPNGLGNLIVGYNELREENPDCPSVFGTCTDTRTGSHHVVVGQEHNFSRFGGVVVGLHNETSGDFSAVSGGVGNTASGTWSAISGGTDNTANGFAAAVSAGLRNTASGDRSAASGGADNTASGPNSSVSGGRDNEASGNVAVVSGGEFNTASGFLSSVSAGLRNTASGDNTTSQGGHTAVSGGRDNEASGNFSSVSGGEGNTASGFVSSVSGGFNRTAAGDFDWVAGNLFEDD
jgi:trimeric autotransporter adhesin